MMTRTFLPVGQGACYLEQFEYGGDRFTVMYDCGSITREGAINALLPQYLPKKTTIDALFISHFDIDHVNGLPFVLQEYVVKNLFLPLITEDECSLLRLYFTAFSSSSEERMVFDQLLIGSYQQEGISIIYVRPEASDNETPVFRDGNLQTIRSGGKISERILRREALQGLPFNWEFVPFNFKQKSRMKELQDALQRVFGQPLSLQEVVNRLNGNKICVADIKKAYKFIKGNPNENSLVLFSGSTDENLKQRYASACIKVNSSLILLPSTPSGCLYTGDYNAKGTSQWNELDRAFNSYWKRIGCIQIPHHGSSNSYNEKLTDNPSCYYVISAGTHNTYYHPNKLVLSDMLLKKLYPFWVTENPTTTMVLKV